MAEALTPSATSSRQTLSHMRLVRQKTRVRPLARARRVRLGLVHVVDLEEAVGHGLDGRGAVVGGVHHGVHHAAGQAGDGAVERGREEHIWMSLGT